MINYPIRDIYPDITDRYKRKYFAHKMYVRYRVHWREISGANNMFFEEVICFNGSK